MKTKTLVRIGILPLLAFLIFACKKEAQLNTSSDLLISQSATQKVTSQEPGENWSVDIQVTKNECNEQIFTLTGLNKPGNPIQAGTGSIEFTINNGSVVVGGPYKNTSPLVVTTHLAPGTYALAATISNGQKLKGESFASPITVEPCADCPYKSLKELTCADLPLEMYIGEVKYTHDDLCQLLAYNRGNHGYGALVRLAQAVLVAKANGFTSENSVVAAAEVLIGKLNALNSKDQASVVDQYGAPEKGHVQDLVKCAE